MGQPMRMQEGCLQPMRRTHGGRGLGCSGWALERVGAPGEGLRSWGADMGDTYLVLAGAAGDIVTPDCTDVPQQST